MYQQQVAAGAVDERADRGAALPPDDEVTFLTV
jgi:hypothetical protein